MIHRAPDVGTTVVKAHVTSGMVVMVSLLIMDSVACFQWRTERLSNRPIVVSYRCTTKIRMTEIIRDSSFGTEGGQA